MKTTTFDKALEIIESFPEEQRESMIGIVKRRLIEEKRKKYGLKNLSSKL